MLKCNTLIINNSENIESGNIPVNIGEREDIKVDNGELKIKDNDGNWVSQASDTKVKVEDGILKYKDETDTWKEYSDEKVIIEDGILKIKDSSNAWVTYSGGGDENVKIEDGEVVIKDENGDWNKIKGNKYSKIKIDNTQQTVCYSKNTEYEILFNYINSPDSDSVVDYNDSYNALTFNEAGIYVIHYNIAIENLSSKNNNRVESHIKHTSNGTTTELNDSYSYGWVYKKSSGALTLASSCILNAEVDDTIDIYIKKTVGSGYFATLQNGVSLIVIKIN